MAANSSNVFLPADVENYPDYNPEDDPVHMAAYDQMIADNEGYDLGVEIMTREEWIADAKEPIIGGPMTIDFEALKEECAVQYRDMMTLYNMACNQYQDTRKEESYEFSLDKATVWFNNGVEYTFTISAKNVKGEVETIEAVGLDVVGVKLEILRWRREGMEELKIFSRLKAQGWGTLSSDSVSDEEQDVRKF